MATVAQFASKAGVNRRTVLNWIAAGHIKARRKGFGKTSGWIIEQADTTEVAQPATKMSPAATIEHLTNRSEPEYISDPEFDQRFPPDEPANQKPKTPEEDYEEFQRMLSGNGWRRSASGR